MDTLMRVDSQIAFAIWVGLAVTVASVLLLVAVLVIR